MPFLLDPRDAVSQWPEEIDRLHGLIGESLGRQATQALTLQPAMT